MVSSVSKQKTALETPERTIVRRKRFQSGCLRKVRHGGRLVWIAKYYDNGEGRSKVLGACAHMPEGAARLKMQELLAPINERVGFRQHLPTNFRAYVTDVYLPQRRKKWKDSTDKTTTERFQAYLFPEFGDCELQHLTRNRLQQFLDDKAHSGLSRSVVDHVRWDLNAVFKMAAEDGQVKANPAGSLVTPRGARKLAKRTMSAGDVQAALGVLDLRERIIFLLAVLVGMRPGEIFALRWEAVSSDRLLIFERVYRGQIDDPKSERGKREAALPPTLAEEIGRWRDISRDASAKALVFPSECGRFLSRDNFLRRNIQTKLETIGLQWVNFQVLRRTQASLGHKVGIDPKVAADQRGHAIGVAIDTYTTTDLESRQQAVSKLEEALKRGAEAAA